MAQYHVVTETDSRHADWLPLHTRCVAGFQKLLKKQHADGLLRARRFLSGGHLYVGAELLWKSVHSCQPSDRLTIPASYSHLHYQSLHRWLNKLAEACRLPSGRTSSQYNWAHQKTAQMFLCKKMLIPFFKNRKAFFFLLKMKKKILQLMAIITKLIDLASCSLSRDWPHLHRISTSFISSLKKKLLKCMCLCGGIFRRESGNKVK